ncbi:MAG: hypothetical protein FWD31_13865, partial [Planctomycetaceae bacterium]|nr:hypothetical protein [Planctomycetaceae bacterium]
MNDLVVDENSPIFSFEDFKQENGHYWWRASDLMRWLGYDDMKKFRKAIDRAIKAMMSMNIDHYENIIPSPQVIDGKSCEDYKLTRFACYLVSM